MLPEVIYRLASKAAWIGFNSSGTRPISNGLSKCMGDRKGGAVLATTPGSLIIQVHIHILREKTTLHIKIPKFNPSSSK